MKDQQVIGVDLGGTKVLAARIKGTAIKQAQKMMVSAKAPEEVVVGEVVSAIDAVFESSVKGIGIGVPSVVDVEKGIVYDVQNIPSWKEVQLKDILEEKFKRPVFINNDANCFVLGEKYFGKGKNYRDMIGLITGTGMAAGIIIQNKLYNGFNCGAGEFGMIPYLDHNYEYYGSGQFFTNVYGIGGEELSLQAAKGDKKALGIFSEYGYHLGNGIIAILYALDPEIIILGGSVSKAYTYFKDALWKQLKTFAYSPVIGRLTIEVSTNPDVAVLGAAALCMDSRAG